MARRSGVLPLPGLYYNDDGIIPQLQAVAEAEARLNAEPHGASLYLPMEGLSGYRQAIAPLLFGAEQAGSVCSVASRSSKRTPLVALSNQG